MTTLSFQLHAVNQLNEVNQLLDAAETKVTFWGRRVVTAAGYSGSLYLDDIAKRTVMIVGKLYSFDWRKDNRRLQETVAILAANHCVFQN